MPLTFAHPAAAIPLLPYLGRYGVLSALVIGSLTPDLAYFLPWHIARSDSHSASGLLWFCLPAGLIVYLLFHLLLKGPLLALLPPAVLERLQTQARGFRSLPAASWSAVIISLTCGAITHLLWDSFTHDHAWGVTTFPSLRLHLFSIGTYDVHVYKVLQHGSTALGLALMSWWSWRWIRKRPAHPTSLPVALSSAQKIAIVTAMTGIAAIAGVIAGAQQVGSRMGMSALQMFVGQTIFTGVPAFGLALLIYSLGWHLRRLYADRGSARRRFRADGSTG